MRHPARSGMRAPKAGDRRRDKLPVPGTRAMKYLRTYAQRYGGMGDEAWLLSWMGPGKPRRQLIMRPGEGKVVVV